MAHPCQWAHHTLPACQRVHPQELWYQALLPACASLNQEITTTAHHSQLAGVDLLQRVHTYMAALPTPLKNAANDVLLAALSRDVQGSMRLEGGGAYGGAPPPQDLAAGGREAWGYADDERDEGSIRTTLAAAGLAHVVAGGRGAAGVGAGTGASEFPLDGHPVHGAGAPTVEGNGNLVEGSQQESALSDHVPPNYPHQPSYPEPDVRLVTRMRPQPARHFWSDFLAKCQLAWEVFFPRKPTLTPAGAMRARLQMILVSDRCSVCGGLAVWYPARGGICNMQVLHVPYLPFFKSYQEGGILLGEEGSTRSHHHHHAMCHPQLTHIINSHQHHQHQCQQQ